MVSLLASRAASCEAATTWRARGVNRVNPCDASRSLSPAFGTKRFWTACLVTPMLDPIWVHEAPDRRA